MKITDIEVIELRVPGWTGATFDGSYDNCLVLVHTDAGLTGIAEVDSVPSVRLWIRYSCCWLGPMRILPLSWAPL